MKDLPYNAQLKFVSMKIFISLLNKKCSSEIHIKTFEQEPKPNFHKFHSKKQNRQMGGRKKTQEIQVEPLDSKCLIRYRNPKHPISFHMIKYCKIGQSSISNLVKVNKMSGFEVKISGKTAEETKQTKKGKREEVESQIR